MRCTRAKYRHSIPLAHMHPIFTDPPGENPPRPLVKHPHYHSWTSTAHPFFPDNRFPPLGSPPVGSRAPRLTDSDSFLPLLRYSCRLSPTSVPCCHPFHSYFASGIHMDPTANRLKFPANRDTSLQGNRISFFPASRSATLLPPDNASHPSRVVSHTFDWSTRRPSGPIRCDLWELASFYGGASFVLSSLVRMSRFIAPLLTRLITSTSLTFEIPVP